MGFINLWRLIIRKRNSCASALVSLSDVHPPSVYKSHILNGPINKLYVQAITQVIVLGHRKLNGDVSQGFFKSKFLVTRN